MRLKHFYLVLCVLGFILPYYFMTEFIMDNGPDMVLMFGLLFAGSATAFFGMDLMVTAITVIAFIVVEGKRIGMKRWWLPIVAIFAVGVSLGFPLFLYLRAVHMEKNIKGS